ncbi:hypothetical protein MN608_00354 [Microdochium nivale]|nr:hypothetical protein MN608_00354 [Microdochium nivale]
MAMMLPSMLSLHGLIAAPSQPTSSSAPDPLSEPPAARHYNTASIRGTPPQPVRVIRPVELDPRTPQSRNLARLVQTQPPREREMATLTPMLTGARCPTENCEVWLARLQNPDKPHHPNLD